VPSGPFEGCGQPPDPPAVDAHGNVWTYFKSRWAYLARPCGFGTKHQVDLGMIDPKTGDRIVVDRGRRADNAWYAWETDNLYAMTFAGPVLLLRQSFRGTVALRTDTAEARALSNLYHIRDGGTWRGDIQYAENYERGDRVPRASMKVPYAPPAVATAVGMHFLVEDFCLTRWRRIDEHPAKIFPGSNPSLDAGEPKHAAEVEGQPDSKRDAGLAFHLAGDRLAGLGCLSLANPGRGDTACGGCATVVGCLATGDRSDSRRRPSGTVAVLGRGSGQRGFFLELVPEVGRYLHDHLREAVLVRHQALVKDYPHWWVYRPWYASGWTGHESAGLPPEILGMIFPIERWVMKASPETLVGYQPQNAAHGIGDCHAIEAIVSAISAHHPERWVDVR